VPRGACRVRPSVRWTWMRSLFATKLMSDMG
jgi:hypothetical protein